MENEIQHKVIGICTTVCRFVLAGVFIFSGFVKAIDLLGTQYKIQDYLEALGWTDAFPELLSFLVSALLGMMEFCLGVYLFFGIRRIIAPRAVVVVMAFMTPLSLWLALDNPVSDCGCFGDAIVLSNWETFWKNVVLLAMSFVVLKWRKRLFPLVTIRFDWVIALYGFLYIFCMTIYCYRELPVFDFRPYSIGANIRLGMEIPEGEEPTIYETRFILQKDGVKKEFLLENYPDSTWSFVDSKTVVKKKGYEPPIQDFSMINYEDGEDITEQVLTDERYTFLLIAHQLQLADDSKIDLINELYDYCLEQGYAFYCLTSSSDGEIQKWQENTGAEYPFCLMDNITLKTMVRSNPGLMLLKGGVVVNKWSVNNIPDEYQLTGSLDTLPIGAISQQSFVYRTIQVIAWFVFPLAFICIADLMWERFRNRQRRLEKE
ncbi:MAG: DoxX family protein [Bacteroides sp.]|nr:DoxX family protein [Bacteroides sp.]